MGRAGLDVLLLSPGRGVLKMHFAAQHLGIELDAFGCSSDQQSIPKLTSVIPH
jgi:hypothetical protein